VIFFKIKYLISGLLLWIISSGGSFAQDLKVRQLSNNQFSFTEGPAWDGYNLYFSDIPENTIYKYNFDFGLQIFLENSFSTNGIIYSEGMLFICESGAGRVISADTLGNFGPVLADDFNGEFLNSPNDLAMDELGGIYFTDPAFGFEPVIEESVYYISPDGSITRVLSQQEKPNGILYSEEQQRIFVSDTYGRFIYSYRVGEPGEISDTVEFCELKIADFRNDDYSGADGMCFDRNGWLYVTTESGIQVFNREGEFQYTIDVPETPTNCTFGGENLDQLYITAQKNIYSVQLNLNTSLAEIENVTGKEIIKYLPLESCLYFHGLKKKSFYSITNIQGQTLKSGMAYPGEKLAIHMPEDIYVVRVWDEQQYFTMKFLLHQ
jgi:gluconolactonase